MKIISFVNEEWEKEYLSKHLAGYNIKFLNGILQDYADLKDEEVTILSVFVHSSVGEKEMNQFPNLKAIITRSTGFDHIDLDEAKNAVSVSLMCQHMEKIRSRSTLLLLFSRYQGGYMRRLRKF